MNDRIKGFYQEHILAKSKDESRVGQLEDPTHVLEAYNPMCGDKYTLYLCIQDDVVKEAMFEGYGCAISKASTAVLTDLIIGRSLNEIAEATQKFLELIDAESDKEPEEITSDDQLLAFAAAREFPERRTCASLSWDEMDSLA